MLEDTNNELMFLSKERHVFVLGGVNLQVFQNALSV